MKTDQDYLLRLLEAFKEVPGSTVTIEELGKTGLDYKDGEFVHHLYDLAERGLIEREDKNRGLASGEERTVPGSGR